MMNSKGFRMRRDHEVKQELGITTEEDRKQQNPERPLGRQRQPNVPDAPGLSLLSRMWRRITR